MAEPAPISDDAYLSAERRADRKHEICSGVVRAMAGASWAHWVVQSNLVVVLRRALAGKPCRPGGTDLRVQVLETGAHFYPDALIVCGEPRFRADGQEDTLLNPTAVFEVVSPSTAAYDRGEKFSHYERIAELQLYVLVETERPRVEVFRRLGDGALRRTAADGLEAVADLNDPVGSLPLAELYAGLPFAP